MDDTNTNSTNDTGNNASNTGNASNTQDKGVFERSKEEMAWDAEFADMKDSAGGGVPNMLGDMAKLLAQVPVALAQLPMALLPEETARHARAAAREGFLAVRSLLGAIGDGIENMLSEPSEQKTASGGPQGTWGNRRYGSRARPNPPGKARRIEVQDEVSEMGGGNGEPTVTIDDLGAASEEGRGLRADIDY